MKFVLAIAMLLVTAATSCGAEIELRPEAQASGTIVTLGDVAVITGADSAALKALELVPAPAAGRTRALKLREVHDLLALQGVKLVDHEFYGASTVQISGAGLVATTAPALKASRSARAQIATKVERAIQRYLHQVADDRITWEIALHLNDEQIQALSIRSGELVATGGQDPWTGEQAFTLQLATAKGVVRVPVVAMVAMPEMVVVARRPFRRGEVVRASDVELQMPPSSQNEIGLVTRIEDIVGRETIRSVATGQPIEASWVRKPVLVRRGEVVTVFARAHNLVVRTQAKAIEEGGLDDVVTVERLDNRQRFSARVIGVQELEVFVGGVRVTSQP